MPDTNDNQNIQPADDIASGIGNLSKIEWVSMCAFFNASRYNNPTTENEMRLKLGMTKEEAFKPEFTETVSLFGKLANIGHDFEAGVKGEVLSLGDDISSYAVTAQTTYERFAELVDKFAWDETEGLQGKFDELVKLWGNKEVSGRSDKIKSRIKSLLDALVVEAKTRAVKAETLHQTIMDPETGIKHRVQVVKKEFDINKINYDNKFGSESAEVVKFKKEVAELQEELKKLRKKENDEVIVLATSPVYLAIPLFGPLVMAGVQIGVGVDLAKTRAKIESKAKEAEKIQAQLGISESFVSHYQSGGAMVEQISKDIAVVVPQLAKLGNGWRVIAADIGKISHMLGDQGSTQVAQEKWDNFIVTLSSAGKMWESVGEKANLFRDFSTPKKIESASEIPDAVAA